MTAQQLLVLQVALAADGFYGSGEQFGRWAADANLNRSQITSLESIANSSVKVADVLDYLKKQTGKAKPQQGWRQQDAQGAELGPQLIECLGAGLRSQRDIICQKVGEQSGATSDAALQQQAHLALIREFVRQVAAQYELKEKRETA